MSKIENISIAGKDDGSICLKWNWPSDVKCVRVFLLNKLGDTPPEKLPANKLNRVSELCFINEFRAAGNRYNYQIKHNDTGKLSFLVYACSDDGQTLFDGFKSDIVSDTAHSSTIMFSITYQRAARTKNYKIAYIEITSETDIAADVMEYIVFSAHYPIKNDMIKGTNRIGPIILPSSAMISMGISENHANEYTLQHI